MSSHGTPRLVVLISGSGTNLQAIIDATLQNRIDIDIAAVISDQEQAYGLKRAKQAGIETRVLKAKGIAGRDAYDKALLELIQTFKPDLVVLAGFMRILTAGFVDHFSGRILNIHPSLLPAFRGLHTHQRALEARAIEHGASIHFVTEELDGGPVIIQGKVPVLPDDNAASLAARVLTIEHKIYPLAIDWCARGRLALRNNQVFMDGKPMQSPIIYRDGLT